MSDISSDLFSSPTWRKIDSVNIFGYWQGASGSILHFQKNPGAACPIKVSGTALNQKVEGDGAIEADRLKLCLFLSVTRTALTLDLALPTDSSDTSADYMSGTATNGDRTSRPVNFSRLAADVEGTWQEGSESSLSFEEPALDWFGGEQHVRSKVTGCIFGRWGEGTLKAWLGRHVSGTFKAKEYSHHNQYLQDHLWSRNYRESYERECPKEGWWAADALYVSVVVSPDGQFMTGTVSPMGRLDGNDKIESHVQLSRAVVRPVPGSWL